MSTPPLQLANRRCVLLSGTGERYMVVRSVSNSMYQPQSIPQSQLTCQFSDCCERRYFHLFPLSFFRDIVTVRLGNFTVFLPILSLYVSLGRSLFRLYSRLIRTLITSFDDRICFSTFSFGTKVQKNGPVLDRFRPASMRLSL